MKKIAIRLLILLAVAAAVAGAFYLVQQLPTDSEEELALTEVKRGDLVVATHFRGELRTVRSLTLTAPNLGSQSQITQLAPAGALAERGDLIVELDDSERVAMLEDSQLEVQQINEQLKQAETELEIRKSQDEVALLQAEYQVRQAELEVRRNELLSAIDARKNELTLEEAQRRQAKLKEDIKNRLAQREAELAVYREQLRKAQLDAERERRRIEQARVLAPISGLVQLLENRSGGRGGFGTSTPTVRAGDQVPPGMAVAQLLDLSEMELTAKVEEVERAILREGQQAFIRLDALPGKTLPGEIKRLGNTASLNVFRGEASKKFDAAIAVDMGRLLEEVGAKPEQIERILTTARRNAAQGYGGAPARIAPALAAGGAGGPAGDQGGPASQARRQVPGGGRQMPPEMRERMQELLQGREISELSDEERQQLRQQMRQTFQGSGPPGGEAAGSGGAPGGAPNDGSRPAGGIAGRFGVLLPRTVSAFTPEQRASARLPEPPEPGSDIDVLLRPGLLADVEVIVENIPDALYVPFQAVFESSEGPVVYLWNGSSLERRRVELGRRSESQVAIVSGLEEGDLVSLESPDREAGARKKKGGKKAEKAVPSQPGLPTGGRGGF